MKFLRVFSVFALSFCSVILHAQIQSVTLQASGLTCSMCSRAIYKSLLKVPSVAKVQEDIEHSNYHIQFIAPDKVSPAALKKAVTDAGFSVAKMELLVDFTSTNLSEDSTLKLNDLVFHFTSRSEKLLNGQRKLLILNKGYITEKDRKKYNLDVDNRVKDAVDNIYQVVIAKS